jgi:hypothetical protein
MRYLIPCEFCRGSGRIGLNFAPQDCTKCGGSGEIPKTAAELTRLEAEHIRAEIAPIPPDPDVEFNRSGIIEHNQTMLTRWWTEVAIVPGIEPVAIDLVNTRGTIMRIQPAYRSGKFHHLDVVAQSHKYEFPPDPSEETEASAASAASTPA